MSQYKKNLNDYKSEIHLGEFMKNYGFAAHKRSTPNHLRMKNESTGELFIIQKNQKGYYTYWDPGNPSTRGSTIIDFIQDRHHHERPTGKDVFDLGRVRGVMDRYLGSNIYIPPDRSEIKLTNDRPKPIGEMLIEEFNIKSYKQRDFLKRRGISDETLDSELFKTSVFNSTYIDEKTGKEYTNTAFIIRDREGIIGIEQRNENFAGTFGNKYDGLWRTEYTGKKNNKLFIAESPVDCIGHYELNKDKNIQYYSTCGALTEKQCTLFEEQIGTLQPKSIHIGFDNDKAGAVYTAKLLGKIQLPDSYYDKKDNFSYANIIPAQIDNNKTGLVTFIIPSKNNEESILNVNRLKNSFNKFNNELAGKFSEGKTFDLKYKILGENSSTTTVVFKSYKENWNMINQLILDEKFKHSKALNITKSLAKDFNDDLMIKAGIKTIEKATGIDNKISEFHSNFSKQISDSISLAPKMKM